MPVATTKSSVVPQQGGGNLAARPIPAVIPSPTASPRMSMSPGVAVHHGRAEAASNASNALAPRAAPGDVQAAARLTPQQAAAQQAAAQQAQQQLLKWQQMQKMHGGMPLKEKLKNVSSGGGGGGSSGGGGGGSSGGGGGKPLGYGGLGSNGIYAPALTRAIEEVRAVAAREPIPTKARASLPDSILQKLVNVIHVCKGGVGGDISAGAGAQQQALPRGLLKTLMEFLDPFCSHVTLQKRMSDISKRVEGRLTGT